MSKALYDFDRSVKMGKVLPPDTEGTIAGYKEPLREVPDGFGYLGTLKFDKTNEFTQCHVCGYYFKQLGQHVRFNHGLKAEDYKSQFGLTRGAALTAPVTREKMRQATWLKLTPDQRVQRTKDLLANRGSRPRGAGKSLQQKNREGRCPDQLLQKIIDLSELTEHTPSMKDCADILGHGWRMSILRTFGTWNNAVKLAGLKPNTAADGAKTRYSEVQAVAMLRDFKDQHGREPYISDLKDGLLPSEDVYRRLFGKFSKAKEFAYDQRTAN